MKGSASKWLCKWFVLMLLQMEGELKGERWDSKGLQGAIEEPRGLKPEGNAMYVISRAAGKQAYDKCAIRSAVLLSCCVPRDSAC